MRLQRRARLLHGVDTGQMRAVGAAPRHEIGVTVNQERRAARLNRWRERLDPFGLCPWIGRRQPQQHRGNIDLRQCLTDVAHLRDLKRCRHGEVEPRRDRACSGSHGHQAIFAASSPLA